MSTQQIQIQANTPPTPAQPGKFNPRAAQANAGDDITWLSNQDGTARCPRPLLNKAAWSGPDRAGRTLRRPGRLLDPTR